jgi:hypothetical protein
MTKADFRALFVRALESAAEDAEVRLAKRIPRSFLVDYHGPGRLARLISIDEACDRLYLGEDRFFRIVDVAVQTLLPRQSVAFVRVSGHPPAGLDKTWDPADHGPFKQIIPETIEDRSVLAG